MTTQTTSSITMATQAITLNDIQRFLAPKKLAIAGASRDPKKFGGMLMKELQDRGFELYPVNPNTNEISGITCYASLRDLPDHVKHLMIAVPKNQITEVAKEAIEKKMEMVWIQFMSDTPEAVSVIREAGIPLIWKKCIFMFLEPVRGVHAFHRFWTKLFGNYPTLAQ
jgi:predicted CoA-binding protein